MSTDIAYHPGEELLLSYASGAANESVSLLIATHLAMCAQCRATVADVEAAGGTLLAGVTPAALQPDAYQSILARLDAPPAEVARSAKAASAVPAPLQPYIGSDFEAVPWVHITEGISTYPLLKQGRTRARLIRVSPGAGVAMHTHRGEEWTLVLTGSFSDAKGTYRVGDVQSTTPEIEHRPVTDPGPDCINLAVTDAPLIFRGIVPKLAGKIFGF